MKFNYARFVTFRKFSFAFIRMIINNSMRLESRIDIYIYVFY